MAAVNPYGSNVGDNSNISGVQSQVAFIPTVNTGLKQLGQHIQQISQNIIRNQGINNKRELDIKVKNAETDTTNAANKFLIQSNITPSEEQKKDPSKFFSSAANKIANSVMQKRGLDPKSDDPADQAQIAAIRQRASTYGVKFVASASSFTTQQGFQATEGKKRAAISSIQSDNEENNVQENYKDIYEAFNMQFPTRSTVSNEYWIKSTGVFGKALIGTFTRDASKSTTQNLSAYFRDNQDSLFKAGNPLTSQQIMDLGNEVYTNIDNERQLAKITVRKFYMHNSDTLPSSWLSENMSQLDTSFDNMQARAKNQVASIQSRGVAMSKALIKDIDNSILNVPLINPNKSAMYNKINQQVAAYGNLATGENFSKSASTSTLDGGLTQNLKYGLSARTGNFSSEVKGDVISIPDHLLNSPIVNTFGSARIEEILNTPAHNTNTIKKMQAWLKSGSVHEKKMANGFFRTFHVKTNNSGEAQAYFKNVSQALLSNTATKGHYIRNLATIEDSLVGSNTNINEYHSKLRQEKQDERQERTDRETSDARKAAAETRKINAPNNLALAKVKKQDIASKAVAKTVHSSLISGDITQEQALKQARAFVAAGSMTVADYDKIEKRIKEENVKNVPPAYHAEYNRQLTQVSKDINRVILAIPSPQISSIRGKGKYIQRSVRIQSALRSTAEQMSAFFKYQVKNKLTTFTYEQLMNSWWSARRNEVTKGYVSVGSGKSKIKMLFNTEKGNYDLN